MNNDALWIREREVVDLLSLPEAIDALAQGIVALHDGDAANMSKTHVAWGSGHTLHALGAVFPGAGVVGTKSWAHTEGGAAPLLLLWDVDTGALWAVIEAFALGQMRTAAASGLATRQMARPGADSFALIGTGKQAMAQLAAVAAVRPLREARIFSPTASKRAAFVEAARARNFGFDIVEAGSAADAARDAAIVTLATRARTAFFDQAMAAPGTHINAVGAVTPEREEFAQDLFPRAGWVATDEPGAALRLSREFGTWFVDDARRAQLATLSRIVSTGAGRPVTCDLSLFKAMGMGASDVALGHVVLGRAIAAGVGMAIPQPQRAAPRLS
jgi:ornithine cyclodeaminase